MAANGTRRALSAGLLFGCVGLLVAVVAALVAFNIASTLIPPGDPLRAVMTEHWGVAPKGEGAGNR